MFRFAYNTNGLAHHRALDALRLVDELGYEGLALTPDVGQLDLYRLDPLEVRDVRAAAEDLGLALAVELGARYLLDPRRKHAPNLCDGDPAERQRRVDFYRRGIDLAADLGAPLVSLWAGAAAPGIRPLDAAGPLAPGDPREATLAGLAEGLARVCRHGAAAGVTVAFEPEPGMFVERPAGYAVVRDRVADRGERLALTLDLGHCVVTGDLPVRRIVADFGPDLAHVHLADCPAGLHEHRMFGQGDLDLAEALGALLRAGYRGLAAVELSRDSHRGPEAAAEALGILRRFVPIS